MSTKVPCAFICASMYLRMYVCSYLAVIVINAGCMICKLLILNFIVIPIFLFILNTMLMKLVT